MESMDELLPPGTKGSFMGYFKRKISLFQSQVMYRRDGKVGACEARDPKFSSSVELPSGIVSRNVLFD